MSCRYWYGTVVVLALATLTGNVAMAAPQLNWDPGATGSATGGGVGTWDTGSWWNGTADLGWTAGDDAIFGGSTTGTVTISSSASANNLFFNTAGYTIAGNTLTLTGGTINASSGTTTISSVVAGTNGIVTTGTGTLTLNGSAVNTFTGGTTINAGNLLLDFSNLATPTNLISSGNALSMGGGTLSIKGNATGATSQTFSGLSLTSGANVVTVNSNGGAGTTLALNSIAQTAGSGATVAFTLPTTGSITTTATNTNGIIGGWAIIDNGNGLYSWAANNGSNAIAAGATTTTLSPTANWTGGSPLTTSTTVNSVIESGDIHLGSNQLTVGSGGIILQTTSFWMQDTGGSLTSGLASGELFVHSASSAGVDDQLYVAIVNNGATPLILVKDGPGTAYVTGANTYTGGTSSMEAFYRLAAKVAISAALVRQMLPSRSTAGLSILLEPHTRPLRWVSAALTATAAQ